MLYDIRLKIDYTYGAPSDHMRNLIRLVPRHIADQQKVISSHLHTLPAPSERHDSTDFFGNTLSMLAWHAPIKAVSLHLSARVECQSYAPSMDVSAPLRVLPAQISADCSLQPASPHHFLGASPLIRPVAEIAAFARSCLRADMTTQQAVIAIGQALHHEMTFDQQATTVDTTAAAAFTLRRGVCQDYTQIMITALRAVGIPAGYVSGFLRTFPPPGQPRLEGADAMHAWVHAWCGRDAGWISFDPTNNQFAGDDYIIVALGRDYSDIAPVRGAMRSAGGHDTHQAVDVVPLDD